MNQGVGTNNTSDYFTDFNYLEAIYLLPGFLRDDFDNHETNSSPLPLKNDNSKLEKENPIKGRAKIETNNPDAKPDLYKTELCKRYMKYKSCGYGKKCRFAHGNKELKPVAQNSKFKTVLCANFMKKGRCPYPINRCKFAHGQKDLLEPMKENSNNKE